MPRRRVMSTTDVVYDRLLREYKDTHESYLRAVEVIKATLEYKLLPVKTRLLPYERLEVIGRAKTFESAFCKLQKKQEGNSFDPERLEKYTFNSLGDMAGVKIRVCPNTYLPIIHEIIKQTYRDCREDHKPEWREETGYFDEVDQLQYFVVPPAKYDVECQCEIQVVPWILDRFWEIEHDILYKPHASLSKRIKPELKEYDTAVTESIKAFMKEFARIARADSTTASG